MATATKKADKTVKTDGNNKKELKGTNITKKTSKAKDNKKLLKQSSLKRRKKRKKARQKPQQRLLRKQKITPVSTRKP
jgi:hypothetical protein